jgi:voltage-gated potassium channel
VSTGSHTARREITVVYRVFISAVTILALAVAVAYYALPGPDEIREVLYIIDSLYAFILLGDVFYSVYHAPNRLRYFMTLGWLNLIGSIPGFPLLRAARLPALAHTVRQLRRESLTELIKDARQQLASSTLFSTILIVMFVLTSGSMAIVMLERDAPGANIVSGEDAVWWSIVTVATVGYGDRFPTTPPGRLVGAAMIVVGVSLFSVLTSFIATNFVARRQSDERHTDLDTLQADLARMMAAQRRHAEIEAESLRAELRELKALLHAAPRAATTLPTSAVPVDHRTPTEKPGG